MVPGAADVHPQENGKKRPLGLPTWSDKLVQEVMRLLLEPTTNRSSATTPTASGQGRGCHTALREITQRWRGVKWFIEGDIKGASTTSTTRSCWRSCPRTSTITGLLRLVSNMLKAGYMEDWRYHDTLSGTPQGGIISPLLSNIYLDKLDRFVEKMLLPVYNHGDRRRNDPQIHGAS